jgi:cysteine desulfurase
MLQPQTPEITTPPTHPARKSVSQRVYLDNQSTTRVDPRVVDAMLPYFTDAYGNTGSVSHAFGWEAADAVKSATAQIAKWLGARPTEIIFTSGATESNNLALFGAAGTRRRRGNHIVSVVSEHKALLDPLAELARRDFEITLLPITPQHIPQAGSVVGGITADQVAAAIRDDTLLVSIMLANNEIGLIQPLAEIGALCKERGVLLHTDAAQAVGKIPIDVEALGVDLLSFSGHKIYGPRGIGALYVRRRNPHVHLAPQIVGGGQQLGLRSGTLNVPGIVGLATAVAICCEELESESARLADLRDALFTGLCKKVAGVILNGPPLADRQLRLAGNLNVQFEYVDGESLMMSTGGVLAVSSGSACTSANPEPSHVLRALGLSDDAVRSSLRFGLGRFTTADQIEFAVDQIASAAARLRSMSSMAGD